MYSGHKRLPGRFYSEGRRQYSFVHLQGYFKDEERTLRTIDEEGWLHTGDIGEWTAWGTLRVIDKIKTVFKLANGDYVDPDRLEAVYVQSPYINQVRQNC